MATQAPTVTPEDAEKMAARIREAELALARSAAPDMDALAALIEEAKAAKIHRALGYKTFAAWRRACRRELVETLAAQGVSNRAIAAVAGCTEGTVRNDRSGGAQNCAPTAKKPKAARVIEAFEELVTDEQQWPTLNLDRLKAVHKSLSAVIRHPERTAQRPSAA